MSMAYFIHSALCFIIFSVICFFGAMGYEYLQEKMKKK